MHGVGHHALERKQNHELDDAANGSTHYEEAPILQKALTWRSAKGRVLQLKDWRRAVSATFGEQPRALRLAWALSDLFNIKDGFAFARNSVLATETAMPVNKVQNTLLVLQRGGAILRTTTVMGGKRMRVIYPATAVVRTASTPGRGVRNHPHDGGPHGRGSSKMIAGARTKTPHHRKRRLSVLDLARIDAARRERRKGDDPEDSEQDHDPHSNVMQLPLRGKTG